MPKLKVLHVATRHVRGGAARNMASTLEVERERGHDIDVAVGTEGECAGFPSGVNIIPIGSLVRSIRPSSDMRAYRALVNLIRRNRYDVVHTHYSKGGILGRLAARNRSGVVVHTVHMASFGPGYSKGASILYRSAERYCARFTDFIVAVGSDLRDTYLSAGIGRPNRFVILRSPIDIEAFLQLRRKSDMERSGIRQRLQLPERAAVLVSAGLLERRKRINLVLDRLAPLLVNSEAVLLIAGVGPEQQVLERQAQGLGLGLKVRFLGYADLRELFAVASLLVHASRVEGVPQVVIQALAAGLPVISTNVEGVAELPTPQLRVVDREGRALLSACENVLQERSFACDPELLDPWRSSRILVEANRFQQSLEEAVIS